VNLELDGKAVLVAGASRGIGKAIALAFVREGARVAAVARGKDGLDALELDVKIVADVATQAGAAVAVDGAVAAFGGLDIVIANVGKSFARDAAQMDDDDLAKSLDMNLWTSARVAHLIEKTCGVQYHPGHAWRILRQLGWSCQRPTGRALERDEEKIRRWKRQRWPEIKKKPKKSGGPSSSSTKAD